MKININQQHAKLFTKLKIDDNRYETALTLLRPLMFSSAKFLTCQHQFTPSWLVQPQALISF